MVGELLLPLPTLRVVDLARISLRLMEAEGYLFAGARRDDHESVRRHSLKEGPVRVPRVVLPHERAVAEDDERELLPGCADRVQAAWK